MKHYNASIYYQFFRLQNYLCEFITRINKFQRLFCIEKQVFNAGSKVFYYTKLNQTQICYGNSN